VLLPAKSFRRDLGLALEKGEVDAVADSEPIGTLLLAESKVRNVVDQATDPTYKDGYCCAVLVSDKFLAKKRDLPFQIVRRLEQHGNWPGFQPSLDRRISRKPSKDLV
jgi:NitT/TauT family transport system substrate-binding protein